MIVADTSLLALSAGGAAAMAFGAITAEGWAVIIGAIFLGVGQIATIYFGHVRSLAVEAKLGTVEHKVDKVETKVGDVTTKVDKVETKVVAISEHTNSMKDALVSVTEKAALFEGELKGRAMQKAEVVADAAIAKEIKLEEKQAEKLDAKELRQETKEITSKLREVKATGEDTNRIVKESPKT